MSTVHLRHGERVYDTEGTALLLDHEIGKGGEGSVWSIQGNHRVAGKFYHEGLADQRARKVEAMCHLKSEDLLRIAAWPTSLLRATRTGPPEGLLMPRISGYQAAHLLYSPKSRRTCFPEAQFPFILHSATNIARAFAAIHDAGQVIGDVNHGNLLVSEHATVALIDCDSFEITDRHDVYPCLVGVPTYTPPELQGKNFQGIRRTKQHDAFGLAVLIFHMLFLGRHPFAGIYKHATADMTIEQAISEYRFAYSPDTQTTQMQPPPSAPLLADFPPVVSELFIRAFTRAGMHENRASAHEWIVPLESLSRSLKQCDANRTHHFSGHLTTCPWCRVEGIIGISVFGIRITFDGGEQFNISVVWAQIEGVRPSPEPASIPTSQNFAGSCTVSPNIGEVVLKRRANRLMSAVLIAIAIGIVAVVQPVFFISISILIVGLYGTVHLWASGNAFAKEFKDASQAAATGYAAAVADWNRIRAIPAAFDETRQKLTAARLVFNDLPTIRVRKVAELNASRRDKQLRHFLESHRIEDAVLPGIGKGRKELLRVFNVEDAYDVELSRLSNIKGIGPAMGTTLLAWRMAIEQNFQFDPNQGVDPRDIRAIEQELNQERAEAIRRLTSGLQTLQQSLHFWEVQRTAVIERLNESAKRLAQTEVDMNALRHW